MGYDCADLSIIRDVGCNLILYPDCRGGSGLILLNESSDC